MDIIDIKILNILKENARTKASAIADEIDLSISAVTERIKKLVRALFLFKPCRNVVGAAKFQLHKMHLLFYAII